MLGSRQVEILFHGGEPLLGGLAFWDRTFQEIDIRFPKSRQHLGMQSNLWLLNDQLARLFADNNVEVGTSIDGPKSICDTQRGEGYFEKTMKGIRLARSFGILSGGIATLTAQELHRWPEVFDFFLDLDLSFLIRPVLPSLKEDKKNFAVSPDKWGETLVEMFEAYIKLSPTIQIAALDQMCKSVYYGHGDVCTFTDCYGHFLSIAPSGDLYPCHRACGSEEYKLGNVETAPPGPALYDTQKAKELQARIIESYQTCRNRHCEHFDYCNSGCYFNMFNAGEKARHDPYCTAYKKAFSYIQERLMLEISCKENMQAIDKAPPRKNEHPLFRSGPLINIAKDNPHPLRITRIYQSIVAAVELARTGDIDKAACNMLQLGVTGTKEIARSQVIRFKAKLFRNKPVSLSDLFLHITYSCPNRCTHCYAAAETANQHEEMKLDSIIKLIVEADQMGSNITITGGEPLVHSQFERLTEEILRLRSGGVLTASLFLSTSLSQPLSDSCLAAISKAFDTIGVSIDGNEGIHDERRGAGSYQQTVENMQKLSGLGAHIRIGHTIGQCDVKRQQEVIRDVRNLAEKLGGYEVTTLPMLPIGRAANLDMPPVSKNLPAIKSVEELVQEGFSLKRRCLLGKLHIEPGGDCYPCYACCWPEAKLGDISNGLMAVIKTKAYADLKNYTVDSNPKCRNCDYRYLCGGACLAWQRNKPGSTVNAPPPDCKVIRDKAKELYDSAICKLRIIHDNKNWMKCGEQN